MKKIISLLLAVVLLLGLISCNRPNNNNNNLIDEYDDGIENYHREVVFNFGPKSFTDTYGSRVNDEEHDYDSIIVNPVKNLRDDFLMGVDASMVAKIEELGGVYYNEDGKEQEIFQIMANDGVNAFRVRIWNNPYNMFKEGYGGGDSDIQKAISLSKRAQAVGMKILLDFHYSDFWADPDTQDLPVKWASIDNVNDLAKQLYDYTKEAMTEFKNAGLEVDMVQIGNEINNGMCWPVGKISWNDPDTSFDIIAKLLKAGIKASKEVYPEIYTMVHLANGGNFDEFEAFFTELDERRVHYDIIGASYYSYWSGTLENLSKNLNNISEKFNKPVVVVETSYGYTEAQNEFSSNTYNSTFEEVGGYLTSLQGQATALRDVIQTVANVPNNLGLGVFYWEPGWLPIEGASWASAVSGRQVNTETNLAEDGKATWSNQGLFSYTGKALPTLAVFKQIRTGANNKTEVAKAVHANSINVTINLFEKQTLPNTYPVETNLDAIRDMKVVWDSEDLAQLSNVGSYQVKGLVANKYNVVANVKVIENYILDSSYEKQGATDALGAPWIIESQTPEGTKVVKLDRKTDTRTGTTDMNWYYDQGDYSFTVKQTINGLVPGTYTLEVYCMAIDPKTKEHQQLEIYIKYNNGEEKVYDLTDKVKGWGSKDNYYVKATISDIVISNDTAEVGIRVAAESGVWGHLDDWSLVRE